MRRFFHSNLPAFPRLFRGPTASLLTALFAFGAAALKADEPEPPPANSPITTARNSPPPKADTRYWMQEDILRMREFFNTTMPGTLKKYKLVFSISPSSSDIQRSEYIRIPLTLRYGLKEGWEIYGGFSPYIPSPFNKGEQHRWGLGEGKAGFRHDWGNLGKVFDQVTVGIETRSPLGTPPPGRTDHFSHVTPFINTSRALPWKHATGYLNFSYDYPFDTPQRRAHPYATRNRIVAITPSILYKPGEFGGLIEYGWRYYDQRGLGRSIGYEIKAGPIWDIPLWRTQSWGLPGKWQIEYSVRYTLDQIGDSSNNFKSLRVRWRGSAKEVFSKKSYKRIPHVKDPRTPPPQN